MTAKNVIAKTRAVTTVATRVTAKQWVNVFICFSENQNGAMIATLLSTIAVSSVRPAVMLTAGYWMTKSRIFRYLSSSQEKSFTIDTTT